MNEGEFGEESPRDDRGISLHREKLGWKDIAISALLILIVSVPTMAIEENWHGHPMIDEPTHLWIIAACLVATAFVIGGGFAGRRRPFAAPRHAAIAAGLAVAVLVGAAMTRRLWVAHEGTPGGVVQLWCLGAVAALFLSTVGSLFGRRLSREKHHLSEIKRIRESDRTAP